MSWYDAPQTLDEYRVNDRIEMHPATDRWMRGDRYGNIVKIGRRFLHIKMDRSGQTIRAEPSCIQRVMEIG